jgi:hypothetical protein
MSTKKIFLSDYTFNNDWILVPAPRWFSGTIDSDTDEAKKTAAHIKTTLRRSTMIFEFWPNSILPQTLNNDREFRDLLFDFYKVGWVVRRVEGDFSRIFQVRYPSWLVAWESLNRPLFQLPNAKLIKQPRLKDPSDVYDEFLLLLGYANRD